MIYDNRNNDVLTEVFVNNAVGYSKLSNKHNIRTLLSKNLMLNNTNRVMYILDLMKIPKDLTLKERLAFLQLGLDP